MNRWIERWHGSCPDRGWSIWEMTTGTHGDRVAYVGEDEHSERLTALIVQKHNDSLAAPEAPAQPTPCAHTGKTYEVKTGDGIPVEFCGECHKAVSVGGRPTQGEAPSESEPFEAWWEQKGQYLRSGGDAYEKTFAYHAWCEATNRAALASQPQAVDAEDAARLDWIRNWPSGTIRLDDTKGLVPTYINWRDKSEFDAAIDAARRAGGAA
ncbi:hypothetical protein [Hydrogenophaga crocea]|uniref:Uncharacterized protein n=1 Tax=Hydrogenophaga crocea TaxID=2716225 RepID=A0A6G8IEY5_9BURK|nr:hypothetical protein [Hydrogenophaga crocea]QIM51586.1 hypothetical protein G9Q37_05260 [Hydrogenophaga crocea]